MKAYIVYSVTPYKGHPVTVMVDSEAEAEEVRAKMVASHPDIPDLYIEEWNVVKA